MKKLVFLTLIMALVCSNIKAQLKVLTSGKVGIGTTTPQALFHVCADKNTTYDSSFVVTSAGNVGIGTTSPAAKLDIVNGSQEIQLLSGTNTSGYGLTIGANDNGVNFHATSNYRGFNFLNDGATLVTIASNGYVGIGTTSPSEQLQITGNLSLPATTASTGIYKSGTNTFMHSFGTGNFFAGVSAGNLTLTGSYNVGVGTQALTSISATSGGSYNVGVGYQSLYSLTKGSNNIGIGYQALYLNTGLTPGIAGDNNVGIGSQALYTNSSGYANVGIGTYSLNATNTGYFNTAVGYYAGLVITTGDSNTFVGCRANAGGATFNNCAAFGYGAVASASDKMYFGNVNVKGCYNANGTWGTFSDGRFKINVREDVKGLEFIKKLRPVTYNLDTKALDAFIKQNIPLPTDSLGNPIPIISGDYSASTARIHSGFIAQEVETAANSCGFKSSIVSAPENANDPYALTYGEFVVPLVKAVQELSYTNDSLKSVIKTTDSLLTVLQKQLTTTTNNLQQQINSCCNKGSVTKTLNTDSTEQNSTNSNNVTMAAVLYQNTPNPFSQQTQIKCFIPSNVNISYIYFYDMQGIQLRKIQINGKAEQTITIQGYELKAGMYMYSLIIDGKIIDTKKMVLTD